MSYYQEDDKGRKVKVYKLNFEEEGIPTIEAGNGVLIGWRKNYESAAIVMDDNGRIRDVAPRFIQFLEKV